MGAVLDVAIGALSVVGSLLIAGCGLAMLRERDAFSRINSLGAATALGMPLIVLATYLHSLRVDGFELWSLVRLLVTLGCLLVVSSVASNVLGRSAYLSGAPVTPETEPQDLARDPDDGAGHSPS